MRPPKSKSVAAFDVILQRVTPFIATDGRAFALVPSRRAPRAVAIRSRAFREWLFAQCDSEFQTIPSAHAFSAIRNHLEAQASRDPTHCGIRVALRVDSRGFGLLPDQILLDLANSDNQFVEISAAGWQTTARPGVPFETARPTGSLPAPQSAVPPAAALETLRATLNLGPPNSPGWLRCFAWLLSALRPDGPFPVLILRGPSGCGKSFAGRMLRSLVDPCTSPFTPTPSSVREFLSLARHNWILAFDHVSHLSPRLSDAICRLSTGIGVNCREEGASEPVQLWLKRPILLTVTGDFVPSPDLAARALIVTLPGLTAETRRSEQDLLDVVDRQHPLILGALCDTISAILRGTRPTDPHPTRHIAAFAWAVAAAPTLGCTPEEMRRAFDPPPPSPIVDAVQALLRDNPQFTGTATGLAAVLPLSPNPQVCSSQLKKHAPALAAAGIQLAFRRRHGGTRILTLSASPEFFERAQSAETIPAIAAPEVPPNPGPCVTQSQLDPNSEDVRPQEPPSDIPGPLGPNRVPPPTIRSPHNTAINLFNPHAHLHLRNF